MQFRENYFVLPNQSIQDIPTDVENLYFGVYGNDEGMTGVNLSSPSFPLLRSIVIGNNCFKHGYELILNGLEKLETVKIGNWTFSKSDDDYEVGTLRITDCPNLRELIICNVSMMNFKRFELSNLDALRFIKFGEYGFEHANEFVLKGGLLYDNRSVMFIAFDMTTNIQIFHP